MQTKLYGGTFYDGWRFSVEVSHRWSISSGLELSGTYQYNRIGFAERDKHLDIHIFRLRFLSMLSTKFSGTAFIQYNSSIDAVTANLRLRYNPREGTDLYLVYNEGLNTDRFREIPRLPAHPEGRGSALVPWPKRPRRKSTGQGQRERYPQTSVIVQAVW